MTNEFNYREAMRSDIFNFINDNLETIKEEIDITDHDAFFNYCFDDMFNDDSITGNASGSYFFSTFKSKNWVINNFDLLIEAVNEFDVSNDELADHLRNEEWEWCDVTIRCYLLSGCLWDIINGCEF